MQIKQTQSPPRGFTLVEIMIVVAIIGLLAAIAIPNYTRSRQVAFQKTCLSNLRQIDGAVASYAIEARKESGQAVNYDDIKPYLGNSVICPAGGKSFDDSYQIASVDAPSICVRVISGEFAHKH